MFRHADTALRWAYNVSSTPIVKMSAINNMRGAGKTTMNRLLTGLTAEEVHKQASNIVGMVKRLQYPEQREYIGAQFGRRLGADDMTVLVYRGCEALGVSLEIKEAVYKTMLGYFSIRPMGYREVRRLLGCRDQYAIMAKSCLYEVLDTIHDRALADMTEILMKDGLIESRVPSH